MPCILCLIFFSVNVLFDQYVLTLRYVLTLLLIFILWQIYIAVHYYFSKSHFLFCVLKDILFGQKQKPPLINLHCVHRQKMAFKTALLFFQIVHAPKVSLNSAFNILKSDRAQWLGGH